MSKQILREELLRVVLVRLTCRIQQDWWSKSIIKLNSI